MIIAIEEPEVHLHPAAQRKFLDYLRWASARHQLLVTTHSPILVDRAQPENMLVLRRATLRDEKESAKRGGTLRAGNTIPLANAYRTNWQAITETLGVRLSDALMAGELNLLVEGPSEAILLPAMAAALGANLGFDFDRVFVVHGEGGAMPHAARLLQGTGNPTIAVVDADRGGRTARDQLNQGALVDQILMPDTRRLQPPLNQHQECEIEDLLDAEALLNAFNDAFAGVTAYTFLPLTFQDFTQEQQRLFGAGQHFGWVRTVGTLIDQRLSAASRKPGRVDDHVDKRRLAETAAQHIRTGKLLAPAFYRDEVFPAIARFLTV